jgi:hypothetical protein
LGARVVRVQSLGIEGIFNAQVGKGRFECRC